MSIRSLALALLICFALPTASALAQSGDPVLDSEEKAMCKQINAYRAQNKLPALKLSVSLTKAATWLSSDMARNDYFDHTDSLGRSYAKRITAFGYKGRAKGENIAAGSRDGLRDLRPVEELRPAPREHAEQDLQGHRHRPRVRRPARCSARTGRRTSATP